MTFNNGLDFVQVMSFPPGKLTGSRDLNPNLLTVRIEGEGSF